MGPWGQNSLGGQSKVRFFFKKSKRVLGARLPPAPHPSGRNIASGPHVLLRVAELRTGSGPRDRAVRGASVTVSAAGIRDPVVS